jgi:hypothetical protein
MIVEAEPVEEEAVHVGELGHPLVERVSEAVPSRLHTEEHWLAGRGCSLMPVLIQVFMWMKPGSQSSSM